jgi:hypothetical protein
MREYEPLDGSQVDAKTQTVQGTSERVESGPALKSSYGNDSAWLGITERLIPLGVFGTYLEDVVFVCSPSAFTSIETSGGKSRR